MTSLGRTLVFLAVGFLPASVAILPSTTAADVIPVPAGLEPGDQYRLAFVTSTTTVATSTDIATYNNFVTTAADSSPILSALTTQWSAIASTASISAEDNTGTNPADSQGVPIYNLAGQLVAADNAALWNTVTVPLVNPVDVTELGNLAAFDPPLQSQEAVVWTGTDPNGTIDSIDQPSSHLGSTIGVVFGNADNSDFTWIFQGTITNTLGHLSTSQAYLYGMSGVLTVPTPEPSTLILACLAVVALGCRTVIARRRNLPANSAASF